MSISPKLVTYYDHVSRKEVSKFLSEKIKDKIYEIRVMEIKAYDPLMLEARNSKNAEEYKSLWDQQQVKKMYRDYNIWSEKVSDYIEKTVLKNMQKGTKISFVSAEAFLFSKYSRSILASIDVSRHPSFRKYVSLVLGLEEKDLWLEQTKTLLEKKYGISEKDHLSSYTFLC